MTGQNPFNIATYSSAPLRMEATAEFDASPELLFNTVSNPHAVANWVPLMQSLHMEHGKAGTECEVGSVRHCAMRGMGELNETIVWWNPPHGYAFQVSAKKQVDVAYGTAHIRNVCRI